MAEKPVKSLSDHFETIEDPRVERTKKHQLIDIIIIAICAVIFLKQPAGESFLTSVELCKYWTLLIEALRREARGESLEILRVELRWPLK